MQKWVIIVNLFLTDWNKEYSGKVIVNEMFWKI